MQETELLQFLRSFRSVWTLEVLLFLRRNAGRSATADELVRELRASAFAVRESLAALSGLGLAVSGPGETWRYGPANPELDQTVAEIEILYRERPATVINAMFAPPDRAEKLQSFADAFRFKKD